MWSVSAHFGTRGRAGSSPTSHCLHRRVDVQEIVWCCWRNKAGLLQASVPPAVPACAPKASHLPTAARLLTLPEHTWNCPCREDELRQVRKAALLGSVNDLVFSGGSMLIAMAGE